MATEFPYLCLTAAMETETGRRVLNEYLTKLGYATRSVHDIAVSEQIKPVFTAFRGLRGTLQQTTRNLTNRIATNKQGLSNLIARVEDMDGDRMAIITNILGDIGELKGSITETGERLSSIITSIETLQQFGGSITSNTEQLSNLKSSLHETREQLSNLQSSLHENTEELSNRMTTIESSIEQLEGSINENTEQLSNRGELITSMLTDVNNLKVSVNENTEKFSNLMKTVEGHKLDIGMLSDGYTTMHERLERHTSIFETHETLFKTQGTRLDTIENNLKLIMSLPAWMSVSSSSGTTTDLETETTKSGVV